MEWLFYIRIGHIWKWKRRILTFRGRISMLRRRGLKLGVSGREPKI